MSAQTDTRMYSVEGMTCEHCVLSVTEEVAELAGVESVDVELASGRMAVSGAGLDDGAIRSAVERAGYGVAT